LLSTLELVESKLKLELHTLNSMPDEKEGSKIALALSVGTVITSNVIGGVFAGYLLDRWLDTRPWLVITGLILGAVSAFIGLFRILNRLNR